MPTVNVFKRISTEIKAQLFFVAIQRRVFVIALAMAVLTIIISCIAWGLASRTVSEDARVLFQLRTDEASSVIERHVENIMEDLKGARGMVAARDGALTGREWHSYVSNMGEDIFAQGLVSFVFIRVVPNFDIDSFVANRRKEGDAPDFAISAFGPSPIDDIADHIIATYVEPPNSADTVMLGADLLTHPVRRQALQMAGDQNRIIATAPLTKDDSSGSRRGRFFLYIPIYLPDMGATTVVERRQTLWGFIGTGIDIDRMLASAVVQMNNELLSDISLGLSSTITDMTDPNNPILVSNSVWRQDNANATLTRNVTLLIAGRKWIISFSAPEAIYSQAAIQPILVAAIVAIIGFLVTGLIWALGYLMDKTTEVAKANEELRERDEELSKLAISDALTGIGNRRQFMEVGGMEWARLQRAERPLSVLMIDADHFKNVNDTYGHMVGDLVLIALANALKNAVRECDLVARIGGEEFAALLPETSLEEGYKAAERVRAAVEAMVVEIPGGQLKITISVGLTVGIPGDTEFSTVINRADKGLYAAKHSGRNRVASA